MTAPLFSRVYLLGAGLIGGSVALALRRRGLAATVEGSDADPSALARALELGLLDRETPFDPPSLTGYDLILLAVPVLALAEVLRGGGFPPGSLVTDTGSVKGPLLAAWREGGGVAAGWSFVPGHPIAGDERSGPGAARADLFEGARVLLTPDPSIPGYAVERVASLWRGVGARPEEMAAAEHDRLFAWVSHLPHLAAYALVDALLAQDPSWLAWSGGGLRDTTRIAASSPRMWAEIALANRERLAEAMAGYSRSLAEIQGLLGCGDRAGLEEFFARSASARRGMD